MDKILVEAQYFLQNSNADAVAIAKLDFKSNSFEAFEIYQDKVERNDFKICFDLASLTKPLTNSIVGLTQELGPELALLLNHRAGLPAWGVLDRKTWKEDLAKYEIKESETLYSDFSALRFMLEAEKQFNLSYKEYLSQYWDREIYFWKDITQDQLVLQNGFYNSRPNIGRVHDPNAFNLNCFCSHAGLFGTISGLAKTLLSLDQKYRMIEKVALQPRVQRFVGGFDTVSSEDSLAGRGCSKHTFGHLGFTGTSFWIDPERRSGWILLSNATKYYWFDKKELNHLRRITGKSIWQST